MRTPPPPSSPSNPLLDPLQARQDSTGGLYPSIMQMPSTHLPSYYPSSDPSASSTSPLYSSLLDTVGIPQGSVPARTWVPRNRPTWDENPLSGYHPPASDTNNNSDQWTFQESFQADQQPNRAASYPMIGPDHTSAPYPAPLRPDSVPLDTTQSLYVTPYASPNPPMNPFAHPNPVSPFPQPQQHLMPFDTNYRYAESSQPPYYPQQQQHQQPWANLSPYPPPPPLHSWSAPAVSSSYTPQVKPEVASPRLPSAGNGHGVKRRFDSEEDVQADHEKRLKSGLDFHRIHGIYASILDSMQHIQPLNAMSIPPSVPSVPFQSLIDMSATSLEHCQRVSGLRTVKMSPKSEMTATVVKKEKDKKSREEQITVCLGCKTTETPEWRKGPLGPRTLCNACGLVFAKLVAKRKKQAAKEAAAAAAAAPSCSSTGTSNH